MAVKEDLYYEGGPHIGELIFNIGLAFTLICIPLTVGAVVRALWLRYRITSRRISIDGGWMGRDRTVIIYSEIAKVVTVPRGLGMWGDMVFTLKDGSRIELRAVPNFRDVFDYVTDKISPKAKVASGAVGAA
ncbi:MAG: PH domain-containing protein [Cyanobacteria bacterium P01_D01_bin.36]